MFLETNLVLLRKRKKRTQEEVAFVLGMKRSTLNGYEHGVGQPNVERLMALADYYKMSMDDLVRTDLRRLPESKLQALVNQETGSDLPSRRIWLNRAQNTGAD
jgi:transcriptional regulator with XRE-family HTH domain